VFDSCHLFALSLVEAREEAGRPVVSLVLNQVFQGCKHCLPCRSRCVVGSTEIMIPISLTGSTVIDTILFRINGFSKIHGTNRMSRYTSDGFDVSPFSRSVRFNGNYQAGLVPNVSRVRASRKGHTKQRSSLFFVRDHGRVVAVRVVATRAVGSVPMPGLRIDNIRNAGGSLDLESSGGCCRGGYYRRGLFRRSKTIRKSRTVKTAEPELTTRSKRDQLDFCVHSCHRVSASARNGKRRNAINVPPPILKPGKQSQIRVCFPMTLCGTVLPR